MNRILRTFVAAVLAAGAGLALSTGPAQAAATSCRVTYIPVVRGGDYVATVLVTNTGTTAVNGWSLGFALPAGQSVASSWSVNLAVSDTNVTATNVIWNGYLAGNGGTATFGFQGGFGGAYSTPGSFALNGQTCVKS